jgi:hypothetical protein
MGNPIRARLRRLRCLRQGHRWQARTDELDLICARCGKHGASSQSYARTAQGT